MRLWNEVDRELLTNVFLALTTEEAKRLRDALDALLADPEKDEHQHIFEHFTENKTFGEGRAVSVMIVTPKKLRAKPDAPVLQGEWCWD